MKPTNERGNNMNGQDEWERDELWNEVLHENLRRHEITTHLDYEYEATKAAYDKHSDVWWTGNLWAWRIAAFIAAVVLLWAATTDKKDRHIIVPAPAIPTTVVPR